MSSVGFVIFALMFIAFVLGFELGSTLTLRRVLKDLESMMQATRARKASDLYPEKKDE